MAIQDVVLAGVGSAPGTVAFMVTRGMGSIIPTETLTYAVFVDWDNDGTYGNAYSNVTADVWNVETMRGRDYASALTGRSVAGRCRVVLQNDTGKYSPFKASSVLAGKLLPGRLVRVRASWPVSATLWTGYLDSILPDAPQPGQIPTATLQASGPLMKLQKAKIEAAASAGAETGTLVSAVLDAASWPAANRVISIGIITTGRWYEPLTTALGAARRLEETELGFLWEDSQGRINYEQRGHRVLSDHLTSQGSFSDAVGAALPYSAIAEEDPLREIYNYVPVTVQPYTVQSLAVLWTLSGETPTITAGAAKTWWAKYPNVGAATGAYVNAWTTPVVGTDITQTGVANGDLAVAVSKFATSMKIAITNNHGSATATITLLQARGTAVTQLNPVRVVSENTPSQSTYGLSVFTLPGQWYANTVDALDMADRTVTRYKDPLAVLTMSIIPGRSLALKQQALQREVSDRITVTANNKTALGIDLREFFIESIAHRIDHDKTHVTTFTLSQAEGDSGYWVLGTSTLGVDTKLY